MAPDIHSIFTQIDPDSQHIVQALAVFGCPVQPDAVSTVLARYRLDLEPDRAAAILERIAAEHPDLVQHEGGVFRVPPDVRTPLMESIPRGELSDYYEAGDPLFTQCALLLRAADYFAGQRLPPEDWSSLHDLQPQLAEFDLRCQGDDFEGAAWILTEFSSEHLMRWGHYRLIAGLRERLLGRLTDPLMLMANLYELGVAYDMLGDPEKGIVYQEQALAVTRAAGDRLNEQACLAGLGHRYLHLGRVREALDYYVRVFNTAHALNDRHTQKQMLIALGICNAAVGDFEPALACFTEARVIASDQGDLNAEGYCLTNMGNVHAVLGEVRVAMSLHHQALTIAKAIGSQVEQATRLGNLGESLIVGGFYRAAIGMLGPALRIDEEMEYVRGQSLRGGSLASAFLLAGDFGTARYQAKTASQYHTPSNDHKVLAVLGTAAWREGDPGPAREAFTAARSSAQALLGHNPDGIDTWYTLGLAEAGLALCADDMDQAVAHVAAAASAYRRARSISTAPGLAQNAKCLFEVLASESGALLDAVRQALTEEPPG
jgi:tetratricopeptide (TPR) repeat protein